MKEIKLGGKRGIGKVALVDDKDFEYLNQFKWFVSPKGYVTRTLKGIKMHRVILELTNPKIQGDHINRDKLDNQRNNLRIATNAQNCSNRVFTKNKYKGVCFDKSTNKFIGQITHNGKHYLSRHKTELEAALWYNKKAVELHKEFANLNKIQSGIQ